MAVKYQNTTEKVLLKKLRTQIKFKKYNVHITTIIIYKISINKV